MKNVQFAERARNTTRADTSPSKILWGRIAGSRPKVIPDTPLARYPLVPPNHICRNYNPPYWIATPMIRRNNPVNSSPVSYSSSWGCILQVSLDSQPSRFRHGFSQFLVVSHSRAGDTINRHLDQRQLKLEIQMLSAGGDNHRSPIEEYKRKPLSTKDRSSCFSVRLRH